MNRGLSGGHSERKPLLTKLFRRSLLESGAPGVIGEATGIKFRNKQEKMRRLRHPLGFQNQLDKVDAVANISA
jgi:hypothetical protein